MDYFEYKGQDLYAEDVRLDWLFADKVGTPCYVYSQRTMLELLNQLDGFETTNDIKVIMATNRIDILDKALLRPGRIDRKIEFPHPNEKAREMILRIHSRRMNLVRGIDMQKIAEKMAGTNGAECKVGFS